MLSPRDYVLALLLAASATALPQRDDGLMACGEAFYSVEKVRILPFSCVQDIDADIDHSVLVHLLRW